MPHGASPTALGLVTQGTDFLDGLRKAEMLLLVPQSMSHGHSEQQLVPQRYALDTSGCFEATAYHMHLEEPAASSLLHCWQCMHASLVGRRSSRCPRCAGRWSTCAHSNGWLFSRLLSLLAVAAWWSGHAMCLTCMSCCFLYGPLCSFVAMG